MKYETHEELIGAYLDGELTPSEQIRVEQLLDEHPEYRQLHEELRALRHSLEALPRYQLDEDLSTQVLRVAEREMLLGERLRPAATNGELVDQGESYSDGESYSSRISWRTWFWPCATIAAALVFMVANHNEKKANRVADVRKPVQGTIGPIPPDKLPKAPLQDDAIVSKDDPAEKSTAPETTTPDASVVVENKNPAIETPTTSVATQENPKDPSPVAVENKAPIEQVANGTDAGTPASPTKVSSFAEGVLLVKCDIRADALKNKVFQKLLTDEHIAWHNPGQANEGAEKAASLLDGAIFVEATSLQLRHVLFLMMEQTKDFAGVETRPQSGVAAHQYFFVYNRANPAGGASAPPTNVAKTGTVDGVNARAVPSSISEKPNRLGLNLDFLEDKGTPTRPVKPPVEKKLTKSPPTVATESPQDRATISDDNQPIRALFTFRLVDSDGKPVQ